MWDSFHVLSFRHKSCLRGGSKRSPSRIPASRITYSLYDIFPSTSCGVLAKLSYPRVFLTIMINHLDPAIDSPSSDAFGEAHIVALSKIIRPVFRVVMRYQPYQEKCTGILI